MENTGDVDAKLFYILLHNRVFSEKGGIFMEGKSKFGLTKIGVSCHETPTFLGSKPRLYNGL